MRKLLEAGNVDNSNPSFYPNGRIKDNDGSGNGTPVNEFVYGDLHQTYLKALRLYDIVPNGLPDNETNGFQMLSAFIALASKNDFVLSLSSTIVSIAGTPTSVLSIPIKLSKMLTGESLICKASVDKDAQTLVVGSDGATFSIAYTGSFKTNEYVRVVKGASNVSIIRLVDLGNINTVVGTELFFLKKVSQEQEDAGVIDTGATTPLVNKVTFTKRVNGADSDTYLAVPTGVGEKNGLMSHEDKFKLDNFESSVKNIGAISGVNPGSSGTLTASGDVVSAVVDSATSGRTEITVTVANSLGGIGYFVRFSVESLSGDINTDTEILVPVFKPINSTSFSMAIRESDAGTQSLKIHIETVKI